MNDKKVEEAIDSMMGSIQKQGAEEFFGNEAAAVKALVATYIDSSWTTAMDEERAEAIKNLTVEDLESTESYKSFRVFTNFKDRTRGSETEGEVFEEQFKVSVDWETGRL